jgi:phage shock protein E
MESGRTTVKGMNNIRKANCLLILLVTILLPAWASAEFTEDSLQTIRVNVAKKKAVLVDVRSQKEWDDGHLKESIFLPITELEDENVSTESIVKKLPKKKVLYTFCVVGMRAEAAGEILDEMGYEVRVLKHGYKELVKAGFEKAEEEAK